MLYWGYAVRTLTKSLLFLLCAGIIIAPLTATPCQAERRRAAIQGACKTEDADRISHENEVRAHKIVNDYLYKAKQLDKMDNDVAYLVTKAASLEGSKLGSFIEKNIIPKNDEMLRYASSITSSSSAIRELNDYFIDYARLRMGILHELSRLSRTKVPATYINQYLSASCGSAMVSWFGAAASSSSYTYSSEVFVDEHVPQWVLRETSRLKQSMDALYKVRSEYLNRRAYIERNNSNVVVEYEE